MNHGDHAGRMAATSDRQALILSGLLTAVYFVVEPAASLCSGVVRHVGERLATPEGRSAGAARSPLEACATACSL